MRNTILKPHNMGVEQRKLHDGRTKPERSLARNVNEFEWLISLIVCLARNTSHTYTLTDRMLYANRTVGQLLITFGELIQSPPLHVISHWNEACK